MIREEEGDPNASQTSHPAGMAGAAASTRSNTDPLCGYGYSQRFRSETPRFPSCSCSPTGCNGDSSPHRRWRSGGKPRNHASQLAGVGERGIDLGRESRTQRGGSRAPNIRWWDAGWGRHKDRSIDRGCRRDGCWTLEYRTDPAIYELFGEVGMTTVAERTAPTLKRSEQNPVVTCDNMILESPQSSSREQRSMSAYSQSSSTGRLLRTLYPW